MSENVVDFAPPGLNPPASKQEETPTRELTRGERLVGVNFNPSGEFGVRLAKARGAKTLDQLGNLPLNILTKEGPNGQTLQTFDPEHKMIIEQAIMRQIDATMWAVKALTWGK